MPDSIQVVDLVFQESGNLELLEKLVQLPAVDYVHRNPTISPVIDSPRAVPVALSPLVCEVGPVAGEVPGASELFQFGDDG